jgi:copper(I)-binding protein
VIATQRVDGKRTRRSMLAALLAAIPARAFAQDGTLRVENAWSRVAAAGRVGVVYLTIVDSGAPDRLTAVASPVSATASLHESFDDHGVAKMRSVATLPVEAGKPVTLAPGGYHIMLTGLKEPLNQGDEFPVTLIFEKAGQVTATVTVRKAGAGMPMGHDVMGGPSMRDMPMQGGPR